MIHTPFFFSLPFYEKLFNSCCPLIGRCEKQELPSSLLSLASSFLSSHFSRTLENLPPNKNCGKEVCRSSNYCSCECEWAARSFFEGAQFKFLRKENRKLLQVAPVIHAWQEGVWSPSNHLSLADFLVTDKPFPSVFSSVKYWNCVQKLFSQSQFFCIKMIGVLNFFFH